MVLPLVLVLLLVVMPITIHAVVSPEEINLGTTLVALKYENGVVVGADSRTSRSVMVSNKFAKKINIIVNGGRGEGGREEGMENPTTSTTKCVVCRSGSAADTQYLFRTAKEDFRSRYWRDQFRNPTVSQIAHFLRNRMRSSSSSGGGGGGLQASLICAGCDDGDDGDHDSPHSGGGGRIFSIAMDGGALWEEDVFCVSGSGSTYLIGYLDSLGLDKCRLYSKEEAVDLVTRLLKLSIARDGASGGLIRLMVLQRGKIEELTIYPEASTSTTTPSSRIELPGFANSSVDVSR